MLWLAWRNLFQNKVRLVTSTGGVALALMLILALDAIVTGVETQLTAYIDHSGADVFVSQRGVRNLHMASSALPDGTLARVQAVPGVATATPILYVTNMLVVGQGDRQERKTAYVIGLPAGAAVGRPWQMVGGVPIPGPGQVIIDSGVAARARVGLGDRVRVLGHEFQIAGLAAGTENLVSYIAFISLADFAQLLGDPQAVSFVLVTVRPGQSGQGVAAAIAGQVPGVTAQTREDFAGQERQIVHDMAADVVTIMNLVGLLIGLAVLTLTVYMAAFARRAEYGLLKALGARNRQLYRTVLAQALYTVLLGLSVSVAFTLLLAAALPRLGVSLTLELSGASLLKVGAVALVLAGGAAILPIRQIAGLDPASVLRRKI